MNTRVIKEVVALQHKPVEELRRLYEKLFSKKPSYNYNTPQLISKIAYRLQEMALGGLTPDTCHRLEQINKGVKPSAARSHTDLLPGTKICRDWNGTVYEVEVTLTAFEFQGQSFSNLSAIARKITGTRWNGPKFFGLRRNS